MTLYDDIQPPLPDSDAIRYEKKLVAEMTSGVWCAKVFQVQDK
jgi:hypothetical protein